MVFVYVFIYYLLILNSLQVPTSFNILSFLSIVCSSSF